MTLYASIDDSPVGPLLCAVDEAGAVVRIVFSRGRDAHTLWRAFEAEVSEDAAARTREVRRQLGEYFAGHRQSFELDLAPKGTEFQREVWSALESIPYGETRSYGEIARALGRPKACRAVGAANGANPIPIVVPCHRVVGTDGSLTGFGGGLEAKTLLLELEGVSAESSEQMSLDL